MDEEENNYPHSMPTLASIRVTKPELSYIDNLKINNKLTGLKGRMFSQPVNKSQLVKSFGSVKHRMFQDPYKENILHDESNQIDLTLPGFNYMGPGTKVLHKILANERPVSDTDMIAFQHDLDYIHDPSFLGKIKADIKAITTDAQPLSVSKLIMNLGLAARIAYSLSPIGLIQNAVSEDSLNLNTQQRDEFYNTYKNYWDN